MAAGRAVGARRGLVGQQRGRGHAHIRHAIGAAEALRERARRDQPVGADIGAKIDKYLTPQSEDRAVIAAGDLDLAIRLARMVHRGQVLAPVLDPANRAADMPCRKRDQKILGIELAARTETAADIALDQVHTSGRQPEHRRRGVAIEERHLRRAKNRHPLPR